MKPKQLLFVLLLALLLTGCALASREEAVTETAIWAMDTKMSLRLYGDTDGTGMAALTAILNRLDRSLDPMSRDSALTGLNGGGETEDGDILSLVLAAQKISAQTEGALDITLLPASQLWGFGTDRCAVPPAGELEALQGLVGMDKLTVGEGTVSIPTGTMLDFGALAKGYAADRCRAWMEAAGLSGILSLGGNIQTVGTKPDGSDWIIGVQDPEDMGRYLLTLRLTGSVAAVSAGDYQRYFIQDGVRYCHILDPRTLAPVQGSLRSVTVVAEEGLWADGLSTALFVLGREAGIALWRSLGDFEAVWIEADGTVWITPGLLDRVIEGSYQVIES